MDIRKVWLLLSGLLWLQQGIGQAAVSLEKMNVLYMWVDNPLSIAVHGIREEDVKARINGGKGTLQRIGPGKYIARVYEITDDAAIEVEVAGKAVHRFTCRVRSIPNPEATVGGVMSFDSLSVGHFINQLGVGANVHNFPFDAGYKVIRFRFQVIQEGRISQAIYCGGNTWCQGVRNLLGGLAPGDTILIDDILVKGIEGMVRKVQPIVYYLR